MHPLFSNRASFIFYLCGWVPLGAMLGFVLSISGGLSWEEATALTTPVTLFLVFICLTPWYSCRFLPLRSTPNWKLLINHLMAAIVSSAAVLVLARVLAESLSTFFPNLPKQFSLFAPVLAGMVVLLYFLSIAIHYVALAFQSSRDAETLARDAELKALKAQINPHFLFNSLHSISALTTIDPVKARDMCIRLSDFLRLSLRLGEGGDIPFGEELALARIYLDVEQVRFGDRLRVFQDIDPDCADCEVPPLLVQPLVENAIKHGIATMVDGGEISMKAHRSRGAMRFVIENPFDPEAPAARKSGIGLANVRNRLRIRYGNDARLDVQVEPNVYRVVLSLPVQDATREARP